MADTTRLDDVNALTDAGLAFLLGYIHVVPTDEQWSEAITAARRFEAERYPRNASAASTNA